MCVRSESLWRCAGFFGHTPLTQRGQKIVHRGSANLTGNQVGVMCLDFVHVHNVMDRPQARLGGGLRDTVSFAMADW